MQRTDSITYKSKRWVEFILDILWCIFWLTAACILSELTADVYSYTCLSVKVNIRIDDAWCSIGGKAPAAMAFAWVLCLLYGASAFLVGREVLEGKTGFLQKFKFWGKKPVSPDSAAAAAAGETSTDDDGGSSKVSTPGGSPQIASAV